MQTIDRFTGSLLAGGLGDALGYPVEFMSRAQIRAAYGENGVQKLEPCTHRPGMAPGLISDDTQMTLFTANGLILAAREGVDESDAVWLAYQRWLYTQAKTCEKADDLLPRPGDPKPFILEQKALFSRRAPGNTCLTSLMRGRRAPRNSSKGCGGVMRVAPCGLLYANDPERAFLSGSEAAELTHHHPAGYVAAGALAMMIARITGAGATVAQAADDTLRYLGMLDRSVTAETSDALGAAVRLAREGVPFDDAIETLGEGWIAEEALAIAVFCALTTDDPKAAMIMAVNHDGDSDSTGAICGNLVGAYYGRDALPQDWLGQLELHDYIDTLARELYAVSGLA